MTLLQFCCPHRCFIVQFIVVDQRRWNTGVNTLCVHHLQYTPPQPSPPHQAPLPFTSHHPFHPYVPTSLTHLILPHTTSQPSAQPSANHSPHRTNKLHPTDNPRPTPTNHLHLPTHPAPTRSRHQGETNMNIQMRNATMPIPNKAMLRNTCWGSAMVMRPRSRGAPGSYDEVKLMRSANMRQVS